LREIDRLIERKPRFTKMDWKIPSRSGQLLVETYNQSVRAISVKINIRQNYVMMLRGKQCEIAVGVKRHYSLQ
jgi:hypothetical protein